LLQSNAPDALLRRRAKSSHPPRRRRPTVRVLAGSSRAAAYADRSRPFGSCPIQALAAGPARSPVLLIRAPTTWPKPLRQRRPRIVKNHSRLNQDLIAATGVLSAPGSRGQAFCPPQRRQRNPPGQRSSNRDSRQDCSLPESTLQLGPGARIILDLHTRKVVGT
jgi:hypothetical protein